MPTATLAKTAVLLRVLQVFVGAPARLGTAGTIAKQVRFSMYMTQISIFTSRYDESYNTNSTLNTQKVHDTEHTNDI